jgi:predicted RecB family endonuclease
MIDATRKCTETGIKQAQVSANIRGMEELIETHDVEHQKAERLAAECRMSIYGHDDN